MALAMCVGLESMMGMEDICGLTSPEAEAVKRWAASALLRSALAEAMRAGHPELGEDAATV